MTAPRDMGAIPPELLARGAIARYFFVRFDLTPVLYFTNCPGGFVGNIDGSGDQIWVVRGLSVTGMQQGSASHGERVDSMAMANLDGFFCDLIDTGTLRDSLVWIWLGYFDVDFSLVDARIMTPAYVDAVNGQKTATIALKAYQTAAGRLCPTGRYNHSAFLTAPREGDQLVIGQVSTPGTAVRAAGDLSHPPGSNFPPPPPLTTTRPPIIPVSSPTPALVSRGQTGISSPTPVAVGGR